MNLGQVIVTAAIGAVVSFVMALGARLIWRRVLVPVGLAAAAIAHLADAIADAALVPEMNTYLHDRMHLLINELTAVKTGQAVIVALFEKLRDVPATLDQVADDLAEVRESLHGSPPGG